MRKLIAFILFCSGLAVAQNLRYDNQVIGPKGPVPFATVAVCTQPANTSAQPCSPLANLCSSFSDTTCSQPNPLTTDALGNFHAYVKFSQGPFTVQIYGPQVAAPFVMPDQGSSVTPIFLTNPGTFTNTQMNTQIVSQVGPTSVGTFFSSTQGGNFATDAISGIVTVPVGATVHQINGGNFACQTSAVSSPLGGNENCVGIYGATQLNASNTAGWGANTITNLQSGTSGMSAVGYEADMNLPSGAAPTKYIGFYLTGIAPNGTMAAAPVMGATSDHVAAGYGALFSSGSTQFPVMFWSSRGAAAAGMILDASCYSGACNSQTIQLGANTGAAAITTTLQSDQKGQFLVQSSATGVGMAPPSSTFANLSASASNGTIIFCTDCKNVVDNAATAGAACASGGNGTVARRDNNRWDCN